jgi:ABC-2 type transport system ATP-binding protein
MDELVAARPRRLVVEVQDAGPEWASARPDVTVLDANGSRVRLLLADDADPQDVLAAATHAGPVVHFGFERPSLSEIFLDAVAGAPSALRAAA